MSGVSPTRWLLGAVGFLVGVYGLFLLLTRQQGEQLVSAGIWLLGAVVVHDAVLAVVAIGAGLLVTRFVPRLVRPPLVVGLVVLGTISIVAIPFVGAFGRLPENPTLLDRNYVAGFAVIVALIAVGVVAGVLLRARSRASERGPDDDGERVSETDSGTASDMGTATDGGPSAGEGPATPSGA